MLTEKMEMKLERCLEILDLDASASVDEARQAYRDLVTVWHPDRIPDNPRLRRKAQEKLKEINAAYEALLPFLSSDQWTKGAEKNPGSTEHADKTEVAVEAGTRLVLNTCYHIYGALRRIASAVTLESKANSGKTPGSSDRE